MSRKVLVCPDCKKIEDVDSTNWVEEVTVTFKRNRLQDSLKKTSLEVTTMHMPCKEGIFEDYKLEDFIVELDEKGNVLKKGTFWEDNPEELSLVKQILVGG